MKLSRVPDGRLRYARPFLPREIKAEKNRLSIPYYHSNIIMGIREGDSDLLTIDPSILRVCESFPATDRDWSF